MARVKTEDLSEGMVVVSDVKNIEDTLLVPAGCQLTERQINILQAWGVEEIEVEGDQATKSADPLADFSLETVAEMTAELKGRFWQMDETNPVLAEVFQVLLRRQARSVAQG